MVGYSRSQGGIGGWRIVFTNHATDELRKRHISHTRVRVVLELGEVIEQYPNDYPFPSALLLGFTDLGPLHVVAARNPHERQLIVVTAYEPDPELWHEDFVRRRD